MVIPSRDGREWLARCLPPLLADLAPLEGAEVIVADDRSSDGTVAWLAGAHPVVRTVAVRDPGGFAAACNAGARAAKAPVVAFLNNDTEVRPGWASALLAELDRHPEAVIAGALSVRGEDPSVVDSAGIRLSPYGSASDIGIGAPVSLVPAGSREAAGVSGVSMAVRADWFAATGGFDERLFMYYEDVELCLRAWLEGFTVRVTPAAVVVHAGGATAGGRYAPLRDYYGSRNRILVTAKSGSLAGTLGALPPLLAQDLGALLWLAARGRPRDAARSAVHRARGVRDGIRQIRRIRGSIDHGRRRRSYADLRRAGLTEGWWASAREFSRIRRRERVP